MCLQTGEHAPTNADPDDVYRSNIGNHEPTDFKGMFTWLTTNSGAEGCARTPARRTDLLSIDRENFYDNVQPPPLVDSQLDKDFWKPLTTVTSYWNTQRIK